MIKHVFSYLVNLARLGKIGISLSVALTTATGFILNTGELSLAVLFPFAGVFFLSAAASALNQIQEQASDKLMPRTKSRPLVSGYFNTTQALFIAFSYLTIGFSMLLFNNGYFPALLGLFNLIWYNAVYTPLKYKTAFAAVPGGLVGAIPPLIGWVASGGDMLHPIAISLATFFFIGQIPHFWLVILRYDKEYRLAAIKSITNKFSVIQLRRLILVWVIATAMCGSILTWIVIVDFEWVFFLNHAFSLILVLYFIHWFISKHHNEFNKPFILINIYYLILMITLVFSEIY